ncbi:hypothetical protein LXL04_022555 [Taraxacum kok-saghyz]
MAVTGDEGSRKNAVPSISIEIKTSGGEEDVNPSSSRVHKSLEDKRVPNVNKNKLSLDRKLNDERFFHDYLAFAADMRTGKRSKPKKLKIKLQRPQERRDYPEGCIIGEVESQGFRDMTNSLSGCNKTDHLASEVAMDEEEYDEDMMEAAEALLMLNRGPYTAESSGKRRCLCFDLNEPPPDDI